MSTEADTCRKYILPKLYDAGWDDDQIREQISFTDGRIIITGKKTRRVKPRRADYLLRLRRNFHIAVVEAKREQKNPGDGLQQAREYAEMLGLKFAYSTNGHGIVEFDFITGRETELETFPSPKDLWQRLRQSQGLEDEPTAEKALTPYHHSPTREARYYQETAINRAVQALLQDKDRVLLTMATGTGKTYVAFQICYRLWSMRWNRKNEHRRTRILFLADRGVLVDDPKDKDFSPFGDSRHKIEGEAIKSREMYFATYQAIARDERRPGLYRDYAPDFFDLIVVDECHRGSARDDSNWREILDYYTGAYKLGMTATPLRDDNRDTYEYFGNPIYTYSLKQGIGDGFLAPYRVHRVVSSLDATGYRPNQGEIDKHGKEIPDRVFETPDFESTIFHEGRRHALAKHLSEHLKKTDRFAKTIVFCPNQESADLMRRELNNQNADLAQQHSDYVCRVTSEEGTIGRGHLSHFQELERKTPVILTTSKLLTTGVDAPMVKNVVLMRNINSLTEFKQIIGRGTRVRDDYGKYFFTILDYTGSATRQFADPGFDGEPGLITEEEIDDDGNVVDVTTTKPEQDDPFPNDDLNYDTSPVIPDDEDPSGRQKFYVDGGIVEIAANLVYELDADGNQLRVVKLTDYTQEKVRELFSSAAALRSKWALAKERQSILESLEERGIDLEQLRDMLNQPEADALDLICHVVYSSPLRTRRERADRLKKDYREFLEKFEPEAQSILEGILDKYSDHGVNQLTDPRILKVPPLSDFGNVIEIADRFGGPEQFRTALNELQTMLYAS